jgi:hypothetical protein
VSHPDNLLWTSVTQTTCAVCLDRTDDGECMVPARGADCPVNTFFPEVVDIVRRSPDAGMDAVFAAVEAEICPRCREIARDGTCGRRNRGECALHAYLPITVDAIDQGLHGLA